MLECVGMKMWLWRKGCEGWVWRGGRGGECVEGWVWRGGCGGVGVEEWVYMWEVSKRHVSYGLQEG